MGKAADQEGRGDPGGRAPGLEPGGGAPNEGAHGRGERRDSPGAESVMPGREHGAGEQVDDGPGR